MNKRQNLEIIFLNTKRKIINYKLSAFLFLFKALLLIIYVKIFFKGNLKNTYENCCLSLYPNFYKDTTENFFKNKYLKLNFFISDDLIFGDSFLQKIFNIRKLKNLKDLVIVEKFISLKDLMIKFFRINSLINEIKKLMKKIFIIKLISRISLMITLK